MSSSGSRTRSWEASPRDRLLLTAALREDESAVAAWAAWTRDAGAAVLVVEAPGLLPLVEANLRRQHTDDPQLAPAVDERMRTWGHNLILFHEAAKALSVLHGAGIRTLVLKGGALATTCYEDPGLRPMHDVDILVPEEDGERAIAVLESAGWEAAYQPPRALLPYHHAVGFENRSGGRCDLHWRVLADGRQDVAQDCWWRRAIDLDLAGVRTSMLAPADQLLHVCVHGALWHDAPPLRWVADAAAVLRAFPDVDWRRLIERARARRLTLPMGDTLAYLRDILGGIVPVHVIEDLRSTHVPAAERWLYRIRSGPIRTLRAVAVVHHWRQRWLVATPPSAAARTVQFLSYLQSLLGARRLWHTPFFAAARIARAVLSDVRRWRPLPGHLR